MGIRSASLAGIASTISEDPWAVLSNPAGMPSQKWLSLAVQRNFGLTELNEGGLSIGYPIRDKFVYSAATSSYGWEMMRFWRLNNGLSFKQGSFKLGIAKQLNWMILPKPYRSDWSLQINAGARYEVAQDLGLGLAINNISLSEWHHSKDRLEQQLSAGLLWQAHPTVALHIQLSASDHYDGDQSLALEWHPNDDFRVGFGLGTHPTRVSFGVNIQRGKHQFGWMSTHFTRISKAWTQGAEIGVYR